ncbi:exodeoxyribonuclease V subunit gamma [Thiorhodovibrio frisius]|uniref:RecBCD enzyme subunit RecC n=1 Tax=Thiorhodovibrio frisius TaxID=631362 RepID=H8Z7P7_9GAMM|nr:exodeoxyribonuclease V subunit gamma [Thiorhodovibrio frisius]EIC19900.1 exodeoxyribonuclease V, gamma subunit [Thiorhodovibrio frisius]WPL20628.1 Exodeoxyribonuclease V gamma chain [Thiorhodovibrio frisius]
MGTTDIQPGFMVIQGNRLEGLSGVMTAWLRAYPLRALENEVLVVQSNGIGQWLKLALARPQQDDGSGGLGIAAAVDLMLPASFIWHSYRAVLGALPDTSAYDKAPLTWRLYRLLGDLDVLAATPDETLWLDAPRAFLATDQDPRRRYQLAERLADLFDQYQVYRADWLAAWAQGKDVLIRPDGAHQAVPERQRWQPLLWRRLRQECQPPADPSTPDLEVTGERSRAEIHQQFLTLAARLSPETRPESLPRRVIVFGVSALPRQAIDVLDALSSLTQVMLFVHNPCRHYWGDILEGRELFRSAYRRSRERKVPEAVDENAWHLHGHPLLAAWGKQGRDYIRLLDEFDQREHYEAAFTAKALEIDLFESPLEANPDDGGEATLLQQLQDDILELRPLGERQALGARIDPRRDHSLRFVIAHGPQREVEILHDQLLDAFAAADAAGKPLAPRDILVMVPAIETYASLIEAVFGRLSTDDARFIPFSISDQGPRQRSPLLLGFERLLSLPQARCTVTDVLDLLDIPALRARFDLDEADLPALRQWIAGAQIRWGLDADHRERDFSLPPNLAQNTWRFGLERMLLGVASGRGEAWQGIEPYHEVAGLEAVLVGALDELLARLSHTWQLLQQPRSPADWSQSIATLLDGFFRPVSDADEQSLTLVRDTLEQWVLDCARGGLSEELLPLEVVREPVLAALDEPSLSRRFLAGSVNFATLMPMRAVPFRQIWLLGMNDGDYPRARHPADFDLMARDYRPGDRSRREDDRYLFLEALLSARERLTIGWVGRSQRDNSERPPSVLVGQLRDHIAAGWQLDGEGASLLAALTTEHPLQPFSRQYFAPDRPAGLFTHAKEWSLLSAASEPQQQAPPVLAPPVFDAPIGCTDLGRFLRHPLKTFYSRRLGVYLGQNAEQSEDEEPFNFDALGRWGLDDAILRDVSASLAVVGAHTSRAGDPLGDAIRRRARAGELPLPPFDRAWRDQLSERLQQPVERYRALLLEYPEQPGNAGVRAGTPLRLALDDLILEDTADAFTSPIRINASGERLRLILQASRLYDGDTVKWHGLIQHWPLHLSAQYQGPTRTLVLGPESEIELQPLARENAREHLLVLMQGYRQGLSELLPLACKTAFAALCADSNPKAANPRATYEGGYNRSGENADHPGYQRFWPSYDDLVADARFTVLRDQLYRPLFDHLSAGSGQAGDQ